MLDCAGCTADSNCGDLTQRGYGRLPSTESELKPMCEAHIAEQASGASWFDRWIRNHTIPDFVSELPDDKAVKDDLITRLISAYDTLRETGINDMSGRAMTDAMANPDGVHDENQMMLDPAKLKWSGTQDVSDGKDHGSSLTDLVKELIKDVIVACGDWKKTKEYAGLETVSMMIGTETKLRERPKEESTNR